MLVFQVNAGQKNLYLPQSLMWLWTALVFSVSPKPACFGLQAKLWFVFSSGIIDPLTEVINYVETIWYEVLEKAT